MIIKKRLIEFASALIIVLCAIVGLSACSSTYNAPGDAVALVAETSQHTEIDTLDTIRNNFPTIDGSSPTVELEAAIRAYILGADNARSTVHTSTYESFQRLLPDSDNPVDMVIATDYTESYFEQASVLGADIAKIPIAMEGFVFIVNAQNPIKSISADSIRKIYSGEITNWIELGGDDAPIIAYQRNATSGSQAEMIRFMGDTPLMDAGDDNYIQGMAAINNIIADPEAGLNAIGYNVYSFTIKMHTPEAGALSLVSIDSIEPNDKTLADGTYPLQSYFYCYYDMNNSESSHRAKLLTEWMLTPLGQNVIANAGFIALG